MSPNSSFGFLILSPVFFGMYSIYYLLFCTFILYSHAHSRLQVKIISHPDELQMLVWHLNPHHCCRPSPSWLVWCYRRHPHTITATNLLVSHLKKSNAISSSTHTPSLYYLYSFSYCQFSFCMFIILFYIVILPSTYRWTNSPFTQTDEPPMLSGIVITTSVTNIFVIGVRFVWYIRYLYVSASRSLY